MSGRSRPDAVSRRAAARARIAAGALALLAWAASAAPPLPMVAAWTDREVATTSTLTAGRVQPANQLQCTAGLAQPITFTWTVPSGGLTRTGWRWAVTGGLTGSGTLAASATTVQVTSALLGIGSGTFSLYAVGPGGWESTPRTATVSFTTGLLSACTVT